jgi:hypothetical protein
MRVSRHLFSLQQQIPPARLEEAALSFLQGANRLAVVTGSDDFGERTNWLREWLIESPFSAARVLARIAVKRTAGKATSRNGLLEHLNKSDVMTQVMDNLTFKWGNDSSAQLLASVPEDRREGPLESQSSRLARLEDRQLLRR